MQAGKVFFKKNKSIPSNYVLNVKAGGVSSEGDKGSLSNFARNEKVGRKTFALWRAPLKEEKGSILFLVVLFTAALLLLGTAFLRSSLQEKLIARNYTQKIKAHYIAEAGMEAALTLLRNQPDYFLHNGAGAPVYMHTDGGPGEEYFKLEWLEADNPMYDGECYTLKAHGYARSTFENRDARAEIKALVRINRAEENSEEDNNGAGDGNGAGEESGAGDDYDAGGEHGAGGGSGEGAKNGTGEENGAIKTSITLLHLSGH